MTSGELGGPVVVAVGDDTRGQAVEWAAAEASARRCALHVVHVQPVRWAVDPSGLVPAADFWSDQVAAGEVLRTAVCRARSVASDIEVSAQLVCGPTAWSLAAQGRGAQLLVLGSHHCRFPLALGRLLRASVCTAVAARAPCPVVIVRPLRSIPNEGSPPRVVVGVDRSGWCTAALGVAFRAAAQRGLSVAAVHAWTTDPPADHEGVCGLAAMSRARALTALEQVLSPWRDRFADVAVDARLVCADPAAALIRESDGAALLVVGSRGRGNVRARMCGSVSRSVMQRARCPVVVVRPGEAMAVKTGRTGRRAVIPLRERTGPQAVQRRRPPWE